MKPDTLALLLDIFDDLSNQFGRFVYISYERFSQHAHHFPVESDSPLSLDSFFTPKSALNILCKLALKSGGSYDVVAFCGIQPRYSIATDNCDLIVDALGAEYRLAWIDNIPRWFHPELS